jgi:hypothetical protein
MSQIDRYTCEEIFRRLDDYVDRQLSPREMELAREHIATCAACASGVAFTNSTLQAIGAKLRRIDVPADLMERITLQLAAARARDGDVDA